MDPAVLAQRQILQSRITPSELAIALTLLEGDKYKVLTPVDYLGHLRRHPGINNIEGVYTTNNMIILWVKNSILRHDSTADRTSALKFFINTAAVSVYVFCFLFQYVDELTTAACRSVGSCAISRH